MRILFLVYEVENSGGNFLRAFAYARGLVKLGCDVTIISARKAPGLKLTTNNKFGVTLIQLPDLLPKAVRAAGMSPLDIFCRILFLRKNDFDIIHTFSHRPSVSIPALINLRKKYTPVISDWADLWGRNGIYDLRSSLGKLTIGRFDSYWENMYRTKVSGITAITSVLQKYSSQISGLPDQKVMLLPVGASFDLVEVVDTETARKSFNIAVDRLTMVYTSMNEYDTHYLIESFSYLVKEKPDVLLLVAGVMSDEILNEIRKTRLEKNIQYLGLISPQRAREVVSCGDFVIIPYRDNELNRARFPNRFSDCISAGRPIITNKTGDLGTIVEEEGIGIASMQDPKTFAKNVLAFIDKKEYTAMGEKARQLAETKYSIHRMSEKLRDFYIQFVK